MPTTARTPRPYLGTTLSPAEYYAGRYAATYSNPHEAGIRKVVERLHPNLTGRVLDLGCGDGLATKIIVPLGHTDVVGLDPSPQMLARYGAETGHRGVLGTASGVLPPCDSIIASYSLHLEHDPTMASFRMWESGAKTVVVISPLKDRPRLHSVYWTWTDMTRQGVGTKCKTIYGVVYERAG